MNKKYKKIVMVCVGLLVIMVIVIACNFMNKEKKAGLDFKAIKEIEFDNGLVITHMDSYSGEYWEDGSNEEISDIYAIVVENRGTKVLQYAEITIGLEGKEAHFSLSTLPTNEKILVLEKNKLKCDDAAIVDAEISNVVFFENGISMHDDIFNLNGADGILNVENISEKNISGDIFVYYKNYELNMFCGGITYRARISGGLAKEEIKQVMTKNYSTDNSVLMMITYTE